MISFLIDWQNIRNKSEYANSLKESNNAAANVGINKAAGTSSTLAEGEKDVDEENMFAENDIENSIAAIGVSAGIGLVPAAASSSAGSTSGAAALNAENYLGLDNDEALQKIKIAINEIKLSTQTSVLFSAEEDNNARAIDPAQVNTQDNAVIQTKSNKANRRKLYF